MTNNKPIIEIDSEGNIKVNSEGNPQETITVTETPTYFPIKIKNEDLISMFNNLQTTMFILAVYFGTRISVAIKNFILETFSPDAFSYIQKMSDYANRLLNSMDADRVTIGLFSNGEKYLNNVGIKSMHIVVEVTSPGVQKLYDGKKVFSIGSINLEIKECLKNKDLISFHSIEDRNLPENCKNYLIRCGVKFVSYILIKGIGFIAIYYSKRRRINYRQFLGLVYKEDSQEIISTIKNLATYPHEFKIRNIVSKLLGIKSFTSNHENTQE